jgi:hypothetical protein
MSEASAIDTAKLRRLGRSWYEVGFLIVSSPLIPVMQPVARLIVFYKLKTAVCAVIPLPPLNLRFPVVEAAPRGARAAVL